MYDLCIFKKKTLIPCILAFLSYFLKYSLSHVVPSNEFLFLIHRGHICLFVFFWRYSQFSEMLYWTHRQSFFLLSFVFFSFLCLIFSVHSKANFIQSSPLSTGDVRGLPWPCLLLCMKRSDYLLRSVGEYTIPSLIPYFRSLSPNILFLLYSSIFLL